MLVLIKEPQVADPALVVCHTIQTSPGCSRLILIVTLEQSSWMNLSWNVVKSPPHFSLSTH